MGASQSQPVVRHPTKILFVNKSGKKLKIKIDSDRKMDSVVMNSVSAKVDIGIFGVSGSGQRTTDYEAYYVVDTSISFSIVAIHEQRTFYPPDDEKLHCLMTIMSENSDGSWSMVAENHWILKRCKITFDGNIYGTPEGIPQIIPSFTGRDSNLIDIYKLGYVKVMNKSSYDIFVRIDIDGVEVRKVKTEVGGKLHGEYNKIKAGLDGILSNFDLSMRQLLELKGTNEVTKKVYYRADQSIGYTSLPSLMENGDWLEAEYYLPVTKSNNAYYVSIDYISGRGLVQHSLNERFPYFDVPGVPEISIRDNIRSGGIVVIRCDPDQNRDRNIGLR